MEEEYHYYYYYNYFFIFAKTARILIDRTKTTHPIAMGHSKTKGWGTIRWVYCTNGVKLRSLSFKTGMNDTHDMITWLLSCYKMVPKTRPNVAACI